MWRGACVIFRSHERRCDRRSIGVTPSFRDPSMPKGVKSKDQDKPSRQSGRLKSKAVDADAQSPHRASKKPGPRSPAVKQVRHRERKLAATSEASEGEEGATAQLVDANTAQHGDDTAAAQHDDDAAAAQRTDSEQGDLSDYEDDDVSDSDYDGESDEDSFEDDNGPQSILDVGVTDLYPRPSWDSEMFPRAGPWQFPLSIAKNGVVPLPDKDRTEEALLEKSRAAETSAVDSAVLKAYADEWRVLRGTLLYLRLYALAATELYHDLRLRESDHRARNLRHMTQMLTRTIKGVYERTAVLTTAAIHSVPGAAKMASSLNAFEAGLPPHAVQIFRDLGPPPRPSQAQPFRGRSSKKKNRAWNINQSSASVGTTTGKSAAARPASPRKGQQGEQ
jgi:hypothetical protein